MDGKLVEGVSASAVETALPKPGGAVLCVRGKHCNRRGRLLERHAKEAVAVVQLNEDFVIVKLDFVCFPLRNPTAPTLQSRTSTTLVAGRTCRHTWL